MKELLSLYGIAGGAEASMLRSGQCLSFFPHTLGFCQIAKYKKKGK